MTGSKSYRFINPYQMNYHEFMSSYGQLIYDRYVIHCNNNLHMQTESDLIPIIKVKFYNRPAKIQKIIGNMEKELGLTKQSKWFGVDLVRIQQVSKTNQIEHRRIEETIIQKSNGKKRASKAEKTKKVIKEEIMSVTIHETIVSEQRVTRIQEIPVINEIVNYCALEFQGELRSMECQTDLSFKSEDFDLPLRFENDEPELKQVTTNIDIMPESIDDVFPLPKLRMSRYEKMGLGTQKEITSMSEYMLTLHVISLKHQIDQMLDEHRMAWVNRYNGNPDAWDDQPFDTSSLLDVIESSSDLVNEYLS